MLIDTHCHLTDEKLIDQVEAVISRAHEAGVEKMIVPTGGLLDGQKAIGLAERHEGVWAMVGIHPENVDLYRFPIGSGMTAMNELSRLVKSSEKIVGIGEIGLDFHYDVEKKSKDQQIAIFQEQLELATELNLPVAIHMRAAEMEMRQVLAQMERLPKGQFHCWAGSEEFLEEVLAKGFYVSYCGNITYPSASSGRLRDLVKKVPLNRLLLETDSPYLAPESKRGSVNEPRNVTILAEYIADLLDLPVDTLINQTTENAQCLYFGG